MSSKPPTAKQLAYLRALAERSGQTFVTPHALERTRRDPPKATPAESSVERRIERDEIANAIAAGAQDSARVIPGEVTGYGSSATWSRRS
jgi:hypothetical protein